MPGKGVVLLAEPKQVMGHLCFMDTVNSTSTSIDLTDWTQHPLYYRLGYGCNQHGHTDGPETKTL